MAVLIYKLHQKSRRKSSVILIATLVFSILPLIFAYIYNPQYVIDHLAIHILVIPVQNSVGIWMLITLFKKSIANKELFIFYSQNERVMVVGQVAASLVHEVRNPLTAVKGFLQLIRERSLERAKVERYIDICGDEIVRTENILTEYLSISKPLTDKRESTDLFLQLQNMADVMKPYANMNNVYLDIEKAVGPIRVLANPDKIKQILINFIKNAIEACAANPNGIVSLRLNIVGKKALLTIKDNGIGMSKEQINRLGTIFFSTKTIGTGLGLTFSYQVIRESGGTISVLSEPNVGSLFTLTFPVLSSEPSVWQVKKSLYFTRGGE